MSELGRNWAFSLLSRAIASASAGRNDRLLEGSLVGEVGDRGGWSGELSGNCWMEARMCLECVLKGYIRGQLGRESFIYHIDSE